MPRAFLILMLPLALTPIVLQSLQNRIWEMMLRTEMLQSLRFHRVLGSEAFRTIGTAEPQSLPFLQTAVEQGSLLMVVAHGRKDSGYEELRLVGCLDRSSGELAVQRTFSSPPPELCGRAL